MDRIDGPLVPYRDANPDTQAAFLAGLHDLRGIDGNPHEWLCRVCGGRTPGDDVWISYNVPVPIPFCPTETGPDQTCAGYGPDLIPAPAAESTV